MRQGDLEFVNKLKALVVDDDFLIRSNVAEVLRNEGWEVCEAESAEAAFEMLHRDRWSLVFCDVRLSDKSNEEGYAVLRSFTEEQPEAQIILMTGHGSAVGALDAVSSGAYDYLMKPFAFDELLARFISKYGGPKESADRLLGGKLQDILLVLERADSLGNFRCNSGPMPRAQLSQFFQDRKDMPEVSLFFEVDYWLRPSKPLSHDQIIAQIREFADAGWSKFEVIRELVFRD